MACKLCWNVRLHFFSQHAAVRLKKRKGLALCDTRDTTDTRDTRRRDKVAQMMLIILSLRFRDPFHCHLAEYRVPTSPWTIKHGLGFHSSQQESCCRYHAATEDQVGQRGGPFTEAVTPPYQLTASYSSGIHTLALCECYSGRSLDSRPSRPPPKGHGAIPQLTDSQ